MVIKTGEHSSNINVIKVGSIFQSKPTLGFVLRSAQFNSCSMLTGGSSRFNWDGQSNSTSSLAVLWHSEAGSAARWPLFRSASSDTNISCVPSTASVNPMHQLILRHQLLQYLPRKLECLHFLTLANVKNVQQLGVGNFFRKWSQLRKKKSERYLSRAGICLPFE